MQIMSEEELKAMSNEGLLGSWFLETHQSCTIRFTDEGDVIQSNSFKKAQSFKKELLRRLEFYKE